MITAEAITEDTYHSLSSPGKAELKEKGSRFIGLAYPVGGPQEAEAKLKEIKREYPDANHHCYAYLTQPCKPKVRFNDDGEPSNSAGGPIFQAIRSAELWDVLVIVVRYFGGVKLGVGGLMSAYRQVANLVLEKAIKKQIYLTERFEASLPYTEIGRILNTLKDQGAIIVEENMGEMAGYLMEVRRSKVKAIQEAAAQEKNLKLKWLKEN